MAEALGVAAHFGDYEWFEDEAWNPQPYLDGRAQARPPNIPISAEPVVAPVPSPRSTSRQSWTVDEWLADGCRDRILSGQNRAAKANYCAQIDALEVAFRGQRLSVVAKTPGKDLAKLLSRKLEPSEGEAFRDFSDERVGTRTVKDRLQRLKDVLRDAYANEAIDRAPALLVDGFQMRSGKQLVKWLMYEEMQRLHNVLQKPNSDGERVAFMLTEACMFTGLRFGEAAAFRWDETLAGVRDFVPVEWAWARREKALKGTKADGAQWQIPLTSQLQDVLSRASQSRQDGSAFVFATSEGRDRPIRYEHWRKHFRRAVERAELDLPKGYSQKIFRNSFVVWGKVCGVPLGFIQAQYGHTTTRMIQQTYDGQISMKQMPDEAERTSMREFLGFDQLEKKRALT